MGPLQIIFLEGRQILDVVIVADVIVNNLLKKDELIPLAKVVDGEFS